MNKIYKKESNNNQNNQNIQNQYSTIDESRIRSYNNNSSIGTRHDSSVSQ